MTIYTPEEIDSINKIKAINDNLEDFFSKKREEWNLLITPLFESIKIDINTNSSKIILDCQSKCLSFRQVITDQISVYLDRRSKQEVKLKKAKQNKFIYYSTGFGIKTSMGEKTLLIDAHVSEETRNIELIENYVEYLRQTNKNLESLQFTIKNIIDLLNLLK